ncbi:hypothetical protein CBM2615_A280018 [Cupriavidus taiwanensis]|nr:hypothetical protein CBM2615_A280018 [Cupriavidus taiwanensis]SOZ56910.1 hypothetical protein CBM2614_A250019 [Cupriavidus taiwanensis]
MRNHTTRIDQGMLADLDIRGHAGRPQKYCSFSDFHVVSLGHSGMHERGEVPGMQLAGNSCARLAVSDGDDKGNIFAGEPRFDVVEDRYATDRLCRIAWLDDECYYVMSGELQRRKHLATKAAGPEDHNRHSC